ncbi:hypothetical protein ACRAWF_09070 [Streptomyces sp. L7]
MDIEHAASRLRPWQTLVHFVDHRQATLPTSACIGIDDLPRTLVVLIPAPWRGFQSAPILEGEKSFGLAVRLDQRARASCDAFLELLIDAPDGQHIPLSMILKVEMTDGPFFMSTANSAAALHIASSKFARALKPATWRAAQWKKLSSLVGRRRCNCPRSYAVKWDGQFSAMKVAPRAS